MILQDTTIGGFQQAFTLIIISFIDY